MNANRDLTLGKNLPRDIEDDLNSSQILKSVLSSSPIGINLWNGKMINIMCNADILTTFNIKSGEEFLDKFFDLSPEFQPNGKHSEEMARINFDKALKDGKHIFNWMHITPSGKKLPCEITLIKLESSYDEDYLVGYIKDLSPKFSYDKIEHDYDYDYYFTDRLPKNILIEEISELTNEGFYSIDLRTGNLYYYGSLWFDGADDGAMISKEKMLELGFIHEDDIDTYKETIASLTIGNLASCEVRFLAGDNIYRYHRLTFKYICDSTNTPVFIFGKGVDIHDQKAIEERAQKDLLTDCYNKISAENIISQKLKSNADATHTLFIIDIDNFKAVNDNLGHFFGDEVIRDIATGLKETFRDIDIIARIGGDEFIVFVEKLDDIELISQKAEKILEVYRKTYSGEYKDYSVSGSVGIAIFPRDGTNYEELYQNADKALSQAKIQGKNRFLIYSPDLNIGTTRSTTKIENANRMASSFFDYDLISAVFNILYEKDGNDEAINLTLSYICEKYGADRSYIFESLDDCVTLSNTYEYCKAGIGSEIDNLQNIPYELFADFLDNAHNNIIYSNNLRETLETDRTFEIMDDQGILSFVHAQVKRDGQLAFFLGLDDCTKTRIWTEREINSLQYIGKFLSIILRGTHLRNEINELAISNRNSAEILDTTDSIVYVSDLNNYDLLYLNKLGRKVTGLGEEGILSGNKCYKLLQGKDEPCDFCTNHLLNQDSYYEWSYYNPSLDTTFLLKDKLINYNGNIARLEIATDISKIAELEKSLSNSLYDEQFLMSCIEMLHSGNEPTSSIYELLEAVTEYYGAERSYIFEVSECGEYISNTYEYCSQGAQPYMDKLQNLPIKDLSILLNKCETHDSFYMNIDEVSKDSMEHELMELQGLHDIIVGAINADGKKITGFVGVDNSLKNTDKIAIIKTVAKFTASFLDETELLIKLNRLSYYDTLTGLKNRHSYTLAVKAINMNIDSLGVLYIDIVGLSTLNDTHGVLYGDSTLIKLSKILYEIFDSSVFRVGGDEFVVIAKNVPELDFEKGVSLLKETLLEEKEFKTTIGYTWNKNLNISNKEWVDLHDGESYARILNENLDMELANGKYLVYLQPQKNLASGKVKSAEALIRRVGADGVIQPPLHFLPFYEREGIVSKIDEFVLKTVCKTLRSWKDNGIESLPIISVNCSRMTISQKGIVERFSAICDEYGIAHSNIVIEITETINGIDENTLSRIIKKFSDAGFLISLDDFGSGYSNLNSLIMSDFDEIKIDMKIISGLHKEKKSKLISKFAIDICEVLGDLTSVAEGVEHELQHNILSEMGCVVGQGYYYAKPMPIEEFEANYLEK